MTCLLPEFRIKDSSGNDVLMIIESNDHRRSFKILTLDGECETGEGGPPIGEIEKREGPKELPRGSDILEIRFPIDLDVKIKVTVLGAAFLIDYMYFQTVAAIN